MSRRGCRPPAARRRGLVPMLALVLGLASCGGGGGRLESFEMVDLRAPEMFMRLAMARDRPFLLEVPPNASPEPFDLSLEGATEDEVLDALVRHDPAFQHARAGDVLVLWPAGEGDRASRYSTKVAGFRKSGGLAEVVVALLEAAGTPASFRAEPAIGRRPVAVDVDAASLREVLADLAGQAHAGLVLAPGQVSAVRLKVE